MICTLSAGLPMCCLTRAESEQLNESLFLICFSPLCSDLWYDSHLDSLQRHLGVRSGKIKKKERFIPSFWSSHGQPTGHCVIKSHCQDGAEARVKRWRKENIRKIISPKLLSSYKSSATVLLENVRPPSDLVIPTANMAAQDYISQNPSLQHVTQDSLRSTYPCSRSPDYWLSTPVVCFRCWLV